MDDALFTMLYTAALAAAKRVGKKAEGRLEDAATEATVSLGRRILDRLARKGKKAEDGAAEPPARPAVQTAVDQVAEDPDEPLFHDQLRTALQVALAGKDKVADPTLAADLAELLAEAGGAKVAAGERSVVVEHNSGIISTGDRATNVIRG